MSLLKINTTVIFDELVDLTINVSLGNLILFYRTRIYSSSKIIQDFNRLLIDTMDKIQNFIFRRPQYSLLVEEAVQQAETVPTQLNDEATQAQAPTQQVCTCTGGKRDNESATAEDAVQREQVSNFDEFEIFLHWLLSADNRMRQQAEVCSTHDVGPWGAVFPLSR